MKKFCLIAVLGILFGCNGLFAQAPVSQDPFDVQMRFYKSALRNYDLQAATVALYNMQALKPERTDLNDSLALLYFAGERFAQAYLIGEEILKTSPKRTDMLELVAVSKQNLGLIKESLADYEKLYAAEKSVYYLYQMATLQYQLKRYGECVASLDQIIASTDADKQKVTIRTQGGAQEVPMKAAAYNVKGICALEMNQPEAGKDNFIKALQLFPDFALAKGNLDALSKKSADKPAAGAGAKPTTPAAAKPATPVKH
jgi:tetratricopeptide (TPR) repeat protein